jgi:phosphoribosylformylglycinamidine synthase
MGEPVARVLVDVMLKPEILDPQGQAVQRALPRMGFDSVTNVRQGKRFELELADADPATLRATAEQMAEKLLANTVIEDFKVTVLPADAGDSTTTAENA